MGLSSAAKGLVQMGAGCAILTEVKITTDKYPKYASGYTIISSKATSHSQGGIALLWKEGHNSFKVEAAKVVTPNLLTFQLVSGYERFYVMGIYIPPNDTTGVDALRMAVMGDLNFSFEHPCDAREENIADLIDEINLVDTSQKFALRRCRMQSAKKPWTWWQKRMGRCILAWEGDIRCLRKVAFRTPLVHNSDHHAVVATFRARQNQPLTKYCQHQQRLPLRLPPKPHSNLTRDFEALRSTCTKTDPKDWQGNDWISDETWRMISHRTMLYRTGKVCQTAARTMQRQIWTALHGDRATRISHVGECIEHKLAGGNVQEAFRHLKGWYWAALETTSHPCPQTMERQTAERCCIRL
jgi:hypothetical protein